MAFNIRSSVGVAVFSVQVPAEPRLDDPESVDVLESNPGAGVHVPAAVVQAANPIDLIVVDCAAVNVKL